MDLHEWLLEHVCKQVPVFFGKRTRTEAILDACATDEVRIDDDGNCDEDVTNPFALLVDDDEKGTQ